MGRAQMSRPQACHPSPPLPSCLLWLPRSIFQRQATHPGCRAILLSFLSILALCTASPLSPLICPSHLLQAPCLRPPRPTQHTAAHSFPRSPHGCLCPAPCPASLPITNCSTWRSKPAASTMPPAEWNNQHSTWVRSAWTVAIMPGPASPCSTPLSSLRLSLPLASLFVFAPALFHLEGPSC